MCKKVTKFLKSFTVAEWLIWAISSVAVAVCFIVFKNNQWHYLVGSLLGIAALVLVSKGNPFGQILIIVFSVFYGVISYSFKYYGEMITYLGMSLPIAVVALVSWLKNPYKGNKSEVKVNVLSKKEWCLFAFLSAGITVAFYFILKALKTPNLAVSTLSVLTSFSAAYLTARRSRFYALGYGLNDIVLITLWSLAAARDIVYLPIVVCFVSFAALDAYGFISWSKMSKRQNSAAEEDEIEVLRIDALPKE